MKTAKENQGWEDMNVTYPKFRIGEDVREVA